MAKRKGWRYSDEQLLIQHYQTLTIQELQRLFPDRSADSINAKIKRLKAKGKIDGYKKDDAVQRSLQQRGKDI